MEETSMSTMTSTEIEWVVLDTAGRVLLICGGADGLEVAAEWADRGYQVHSRHASEVGAG
jgi:heterodisulfide reductase subunit A-like polyferredoxin